MEEWKTYKLSEVSILSTGFPFDGSKYAKEGIRVVRGDNVTIGSLRWDSDKDKRWNDDFDREEEYSLQDGDIVIGMDGSRVGKNRAQVKSDDLPLLIAQRVACVRHNELSCQEFLYYQIFNDRFTDYIKAVQTGTSIPHVSLKQIGDYKINLPSLKKQREIANVLKSLDNKIELNNRINRNLEEQAQALYKSWFIDFEPFKDGEFVESELGMIPKGWRVGPVYDYLTIIYGAPYKSSLFSEEKKGLPLIRIRDLKDCNPQIYTQELLPQTEYVNAGDIVAGMDADFTPYIWKGEPGLLNQRVCKIEPKISGISHYYCLMLIKPELDFVCSYKVGTTVSHLGKNDIDRFLVILPPISEVQQYSSIINPLFNSIVRNSVENRRLTELRDSLLPKLMTGALSVDSINC